jgi:hypothetical protein
MSAEDAVRAREDAKFGRLPEPEPEPEPKPKKPKREPIIDDFETDVPELVPEEFRGDE